MICPSGQRVAPGRAGFCPSTQVSLPRLQASASSLPVMDAAGEIGAQTWSSLRQKPWVPSPTLAGWFRFHRRGSVYPSRERGRSAERGRARRRDWRSPQLRVLSTRSCPAGVGLGRPRRRPVPLRVHVLFPGPQRSRLRAAPASLGVGEPPLSEAAVTRTPQAGAGGHRRRLRGRALTCRCVRSEGGGRPRDLQLQGQSPGAPEKATQGAHGLHRPSAGAAGAQLRAAKVPERAGPHGTRRLAQPHRHAGQDLVPEPQVRPDCGGRGRKGTSPFLTAPGGDQKSTGWC